MKHVQIHDGVFVFENYVEYLEYDRGRLARLLEGDELLDIERRFVPGPESFHDSRFVELRAANVNSRAFNLDAEDIWLRLNGPCFDRYFDLRYEDVTEAVLDLPRVDDDLLLHEVRREDDLVVHEMLFVANRTLQIKCRKLRFDERFELQPRAPAKNEREADDLEPIRENEQEIHQQEIRQAVMNDKIDPLEDAIRNLGVFRTFRNDEIEIEIACLVREADTRPLDAPWWRGKQVSIIGADLDGNLLLRHSDGSVRLWNHDTQSDTVVAKSVRDFAAGMKP